MKRSVIFMLILIIGITWSCKKKSDGGGEEPAPEPPVTGTEILKQTISSDGGTMTVENISLEVPAGAFTDPTTLTISKLEENTFGSNSASPVYFVNDIPGNTLKDLTISLSGVDLNNSVKVMVAEPSYNRTSDKIVVGYRNNSFLIENGVIKVIIPAVPASLSFKSIDVSDEKLAFGVKAVVEYKSLQSSDKHFEITFPSGNEASAAQICADLEEAYNMYSTDPFSMDFTRRSSWPVQVTICTLEPDEWGTQICSKLGDNYGWMEFNDKKLNDLPEMKKTAVHEFFHLVQSWYDPRNRFSKAWGGGPAYWLAEASAVWVEEKFNTPGYISVSRLDNESKQFEGGLNDSREKKEAQNYGYGMSGTIKYLADQQGIGIIRKIYENIYGGSTPGEAIRIAMSMGYRYWYGDMIKEYCLGQIYSDMNSDKMFGCKTESFNAILPGDSVKTFTQSYKQLASKIYQINIKASAVTSQTSLSVEAPQNEYQVINLYKYKFTQHLFLEFLAQDPSLITVSDIKAMIDEGYAFMIVHTNLNYDTRSTGEIQLPLTVRLTNQRKFERITWHMIPAVLSSHYDKNGNLIESEETSLGTNSLDSVPCTQNGNVLTASFPSCNGTIQITLKPGNTLSFYVSYQCPGSWETEIFECTATGIPLLVATDEEEAYWASEAFPQIQSFSARTNQSGGGYYIYSLIEKPSLDFGIVIKLKYKK